MNQLISNLNTPPQFKYMDKVRTSKTTFDIKTPSFGIHNSSGGYFFIVGIDRGMNGKPSYTIALCSYDQAMELCRLNLIKNEYDKITLINNLFNLVPNMDFYNQKHIDKFFNKMNSILIDGFIDDDLIPA